MLKRSFVHLPGIGPAKERALWESGISSWDELRLEAPSMFSDSRCASILECLDASEKAYRGKDLHYFYRTLSREHLWRLVPEFLDEVAYLDIETTGLGLPPASHSTTITFYLRGELYQEHRHDRKKPLIKKMLKESSILATFFGEGFDVPFLSREFGIEFDKAHIDLCFWLRRLGYGGGLKKVQKLFPDIPERLSLDINGYDAVKLWRMHERGVKGALETLLTYNAEDTIVLEPLLIEAYNAEIEKHPHLGLRKLNKARELPRLETEVHEEVYRLLRPGFLGHLGLRSASSK